MVQDADGPLYVSAASLAAAMEQYNRVILRTCRLRGVECIDLAPRVPKDDGHFWDGAHFTEAGAARVAAVVADHLLSTQPLDGMR